MSKAKFVNLHVHSHYSLLDGMPKIPDIISYAKELGQESVAITDHGVMYGAVEFWKSAKKEGIRPILGCELYVARESRTRKDPTLDRKSYHIVLLAENNKGYHNLMKLCSLGFLEGFYYKPRVDMELLEQYSEGLIAMTACLGGEVPQAILNKDLDEAERVVQKYLKIFGKDNFFLEVQHHPDIPDQTKVNDGMYELSKRTGVEVVATADSHYLRRDDAEAQSILIMIGTKTTINDKNNLAHSYESAYFKTTEEMERDFADHPEALANTVKIAERCEVELTLGGTLFPKYSLPADQTSEKYIRELCIEGMKSKYGFDPESEQLDEKQAAWKKQMDYELGVINRLGFNDYFLIVWDFVHYAKTHEIAVGPGRGSGAGSIVAYILGITELEPTQYGLIFERFLNPERVSPPDFDIDFADDRREEVIEYVRQKYGSDHVAQTITFGTMAARAAIRDVGRVLDIPYSEVDKVAKSVPMTIGISLREALQESKEFAEYHKGAYRKLIDIAQKLEGCARHAGTHAAAVIISDGPMTDYTPVQYATGSDTVIQTQYDMYSADSLGLLKMDFLGLKNLTVIQNCLKFAKFRGKSIPEINKIPMDDTDVFELMGRGETVGVFQFESGGMRRWLKELQPTVFEDVIAMVALFRPGPMAYIPNFIARKHGREEIKYDHPLMEQVLKVTYGVTVYQEQVIELSKVLAGFSGAEADTMRRAIGKKKADLMATMKLKFIAGCERNKVEKKTAEKIWADWEEFSSYAFNKSHAACYALIGYQTAYLKNHFPDEFMAALMTSDLGNQDRLTIDLEECERLGIKVLPPDVNSSYDNFTVVEDGEIRFGMLAVKGLGEGPVADIIQKREDRPYASLADFISRLDSKTVNKRVLEALTLSGGLDRFGERNAIYQSIPDICEFARQRRKGLSNKDQLGLFGAEEMSGGSEEIRLQQVEPFSKKEKLGYEKELMGFYISENPLKSLKEYFINRAIPISSLTAKEPDKRVKIGGQFSSVKKITTKAGVPMAFTNLEDHSGKIEAVFFPRTFEKYQASIDNGKIVILEGKVQERNDELKFLVDTLSEVDLEKASKTSNREINKKANGEKVLKLKLPGSARKSLLLKIKEALQKHPGDCSVDIYVEKESEPARAKTKVDVNYQLKKELRELEIEILR